jgi:pimeloyl-ACP methyl ester carboxylesterase
MFSTNAPDWDLHHVDAPVLGIHTTNPMWDDNYKAYARGLSSQTDYRVMDGVGHWLMLEKPAEFNMILTNLLVRFDLIKK